MTERHEDWAKKMMASIASGGMIAQSVEPGDDWTQEDIDRSLANEAKVAKVRDRYDARLDLLLDQISKGYEPEAGMLTNLQRDRKTIEEMLSGMGRARGWREKAKMTEPVESDQ